MTAWTPGPWTFVPESGTPGHDDNDMGGIRTADHKWVCDFGNGTHYYPTEGTPPSVADGALMAAAPEMLHALYEVDNASDYMDFDPESRFGLAMAKVHAAIAKARP